MLQSFQSDVKSSKKSLKGSDFVAKVVDVAVAELIAIATPGQVTQVALDRAKNATRLAILMNLESRAIVAEDIGRQILTYGSRKPVEHFLRCLDELNLDDLTILAQKMLSSPLTIGCLGDEFLKANSASTRSFRPF